MLYYAPSIGQGTAAWKNLTSQRARLRKTQKFLTLLEFTWHQSEPSGPVSSKAQSALDSPSIVHFMVYYYLSPTISCSIVDTLVSNTSAKIVFLSRVKRLGVGISSTSVCTSAVRRYRISSGIRFMHSKVASYGRVCEAMDHPSVLEPIIELVTVGQWNVF